MSPCSTRWRAARSHALSPAAPRLGLATGPLRRRAREGGGASLDDLVGAGEERLGHGQAERLGGLQVDDQLEFGWLLDRQIGRLRAFQDLVDIASRAAEHVVKVLAVRHQTAGSRKIALVENCRDVTG